MLIPSRTKYRRVHRLPDEGKARGNTELKFGDYGLQAKESKIIIRTVQDVLYQVQLHQIWQKDIRCHNLFRRQRNM